MTYHTYRITIRFGASVKHLDVVAISLDSAIADVEQAYDRPEVIQAGRRA